MMSHSLFLSPHEWKQYYGYHSGLPECQLLKTQKKRWFTVKEIRLHYPHAPKEAHEDLTLTLYEPHLHGRTPTILVNPIFRGKRIAKIFARYFARKGFNAVVLHHDSLAYDFGKSFDQIEIYLKKAVIRNLKALDWITRHEKTEPAKIGTFGISFGAIIGSVVAAIDSRPKCHVIALAGAPVAHIIARTRNRTILKVMRHESRRKAKSPKDLALDMLRHIKTEPLLFAKYVKSENVAMYISLFDRVVRPVYARRLWKALGKPRVFFVPFGHYTSIISYPFARRMAYRFFREKFIA